MVACLPICFKSSSLNSLPIEKAINPSATSDIIENDSIFSKLVKPNQFTPKAPKQNGPIKIPATKYAVTAGRPKSLATRDNIRPEKSAIDNDNNIACIITPYYTYFFSEKIVNKITLLILLLLFLFVKC